MVGKTEIILLESYAFLSEETGQIEILYDPKCVCVPLQRRTSVNRAFPLFFHQVRWLEGGSPNVGS